MIIKSISLQDFQCYSGGHENNKFEFEKGLNVIIGDNGSGKSKLYDAFNWVLYDRVFDSNSRGFFPTSTIRINLFSDKVKKGANVGDTITVEVKLHLENNLSSSSIGNEYFLYRTYSAKRKELIEDYNDLKGWELSHISTEKVETKDVLHFKLDNSPGIFDKVRKMLVPDDMMPYLWFQGEQVDSLIDFKKEESLTKAINALSDITVYDDIILVAEKVKDQANSMYEKEQSGLSKNKSEFDNWKTSKDSIESKVKKEREVIIKLTEQVEQSSEKINTLLGRIEDSERVLTLNSNLQAEKERLSTVSENLKSATQNFNKNIFSKKWILRNTLPIWDEFESKRKNYQDKREDIITSRKAERQIEEAQKMRLPVNVPNRKHLDDMISEELCFVCNRKLDDDDSMNRVKDLLERAKNTSSRGPLTKYNFSDFFERLYNIGFNNESAAKSADDSVNREIEKIQKLENEKRRLSENVDAMVQQLESLMQLSSLDLYKSKNIESEFRNTGKTKDSWQEQLTLSKSRLKNFEDELNSLNQNPPELKGEVQQQTIQRKELFNDFYLVAKSTRESVYDKQIRKIEAEANKHFLAMTSDNNSVQGRIILEKRGNAYLPKNVNNEGIEMSSINDSNIILIKLATIMAIVSMRGNSRETFPLITDAPTSKFSDNYTIGFCNTLSSIYAQSIIMSYDFFHNEALKKNLLENVKNVGAVYVIEPNTKEDNRENRDTLATFKNRIK
jgi:DNA sulfur modification protein DndD